jgi:hypothetical protein
MRSVRGGMPGVHPGPLRLSDAGDAKPAWITLLTTEHYNLQTERAATISEVNGRASVFLGAVSAGLIAAGLSHPSAISGIGGAGHRQAGRDLTQRSTPGIPSSRALFVGGGRCRVPANVVWADGLTAGWHQAP